MKHLMLLLGLGTSGLISTGCLPAFLEKYQKPQETVAVQPGAAPLEAAPAPAPAIENIGANQFKVARPVDEVWQSAVRVLLSHYNITIADKSAGILTTEWDAFYIKGSLFRNKVSVGISQEKAGAYVKIYNNVEYLSDGTGEKVWLPSDSGHKETARILSEIQKQLDTSDPRLR